MQISFEVTEEDFLAFQAYFRKHSSLARARRRRTLLIAPLATFSLIMVMLLGIGLLEHKSLLPTLLGGAIGGAVGAFVILLWTSLVLRYPTFFHRGYYKTHAQEASGPQMLELRDDGLRVQSLHSETTLYWDSIGNIATTPEHTFVFLGQMRGLIIPQRRITQGNYPAFMQAFADVYAHRRDKALETATAPTETRTTAPLSQETTPLILGSRHDAEH